MNRALIVLLLIVFSIQGFCGKVYSWTAPDGKLFIFTSREKMEQVQKLYEKQDQKKENPTQKKTGPIQKTEIQSKPVEPVVIPETIEQPVKKTELEPASVKPESKPENVVKDPVKPVIQPKPVVEKTRPIKQKHVEKERVEKKQIEQVREMSVTEPVKQHMNQVNETEYKDPASKVSPVMIHEKGKEPVYEQKRPEPVIKQPKQVQKNTGVHNPAVTVNPSRQPSGIVMILALAALFGGAGFFFASRKKESSEPADPGRVSIIAIVEKELL